MMSERHSLRIQTELILTILTGIYGDEIEVVRRGGWLEPLSRKSLFVGLLLGSDANRHLTNH